MDKKIDVMWDDTPIDVSTEVNFIWSIANKLRGPYQSDKYKDVIIPMTIIRRLECALEGTKDKVIARFEADPAIAKAMLCRTSGLQFFNVSRYNLKKLVDDPDNIAGNFREYIRGFSENVINIIKSLEFDTQITKMDVNDRLYSVVKAFSELDLSPETIDNVKMGYIFEDLIRRFSENAEAGDHYTGRDVIRTMVSILLAEGCEDIFDHGKIITILDQAAGTGGMLSTAYNYIHQFNSTADIRMFAQEFNPESYAICLAEMLIKGQNADNIRFQDTMKKDMFPDIKMRFVLENPPFGTPWGGKDAPEGEEAAVKAEFEKVHSRFPAGLPSSSDTQLLFVQSAIDKLAENGRAAIIENGSPLFTGGTASGESQIRRWLLDQDYLEAIIALPTDLFYNTGIATYIWVLSKSKRVERKGKVQLIDATSFYKPLRKSLGNKRVEISPEDRDVITKLYTGFVENEYCKIFRNSEFKYREYTILQPLQRSYCISKERIETLISGKALSGIYDEAKISELESKDEFGEKDRKKLEELKQGEPLFRAILEALNSAVSSKKYLSISDFEPVLFSILGSVTDDKKLLEKIADGLSVMDKEAEIQKDKKGNIIYDKATKDTEIVKYEEDIEEYMKREVLPFVPDAKYFFEEDLSKKKPVIKTGAEIPFTRYFYKYEKPESSEELAKKFNSLEEKVNERIKRLFETDIL
ncbi:MAG: N-6 DNA methylase [Lachnospiraceae bacterium]|nr:N-6 DNA methylase [Lachnospiraceae bacterium]